MTKARQKGIQKVNEMKIKVRETSGNHQGYIEWIEKFDFGNLSVEDRRTTKNDEDRTIDGGKSSRNHPRKRFRRVTEAPRLGFSSRKRFFFTNFKWSSDTRKVERLYSSLCSLFIGKRRRSLPPSSPRRDRLLPPKGTTFWRNFLEGPSGPGCYLHPLFTKYTPAFLLLILFP